MSNGEKQELKRARLSESREEGRDSFRVKNSSRFSHSPLSYCASLLCQTLTALDKYTHGKGSIKATNASYVDYQSLAYFLKANGL